MGKLTVNLVVVVTTAFVLLCTSIYTTLTIQDTILMVAVWASFIFSMVTLECVYNDYVRFSAVSDFMDNLPPGTMLDLTQDKEDDNE